MTTPLLDGYGCAVGQMAITRPSKPIPLGMQTTDTAGSRFSGSGAHCIGAVPKLLMPRRTPGTAFNSNVDNRSAHHMARRHSSRLLLFLWSEHHDHLAPFHFRHLLDLTHFVEVRAQALEHAHTAFLVIHL